MSLSVDRQEDCRHLKHCVQSMGRPLSDGEGLDTACVLTAITSLQQHFTGVSKQRMLCNLCKEARKSIGRSSNVTEGERKDCCCANCGQPLEIAAIKFHFFHQPALLFVCSGCGLAKADDAEPEHFGKPIATRSLHGAAMDP